VSKGISAGKSQNSYRGLVRMAKGAVGARNYSQCDSLLIGKDCGAHTFPDIQSFNPTAVLNTRLPPPKYRRISCFTAVRGV